MKQPPPSIASSGGGFPPSRDRRMMRLAIAFLVALPGCAILDVLGQGEGRVPG